MSWRMRSSASCPERWVMISSHPVRDERRAQVPDLPVQLHRERRPRQALSDRGGRVEPGGALGRSSRVPSGSVTVMAPMLREGVGRGPPRRHAPPRKRAFAGDLRHTADRSPEACANFVTSKVGVACWFGAAVRTTRRRSTRLPETRLADPDRSRLRPRTTDGATDVARAAGRITRAHQHLRPHPPHRGRHRPDRRPHRAGGFGRRRRRHAGRQAAARLHPRS